MLIESLKHAYPLIYRAAIENSRYHGGAHISSFIWDDTREGHQFWSYVNNNRINEALQICPHLDDRSYRRMGAPSIWEANTWVVARENGYYGISQSCTNAPIRKGEIFKIDRESEPYKRDYLILKGAEYYASKDLFKWFSSQSEAESFSRLLLTSGAYTSPLPSQYPHRRIDSYENTEEKKTEPRKLELISSIPTKTLSQVTKTNNIKIK